MHILAIVLVAVLTTTVAQGPVWAETSNPTGQSRVSSSPTEAAIETVRAFNQAMSTGDKDNVLAQLADGGVQFTLRALHEGVNPDKLTAPILPHWTMIAPVIFASTDGYTRDVEILSAEAHGDIATVWTRTTTTSVRKSSSETTTATFTEVYLVIATNAEWKIAAIADNRVGTTLAPDN